MRKKVCMGSKDLPRGTPELSVTVLNQAWFCMSIVSFPHSALSLHLHCKKMQCEVIYIYTHIYIFGSHIAYSQKHTFIINVDNEIISCHWGL